MVSAWYKVWLSLSLTCGRSRPLKLTKWVFFSSHNYIQRSVASALSAHLVVTDTVHTCSLQTRNTPLGSVTPDSATPNHRNNQYQVQLGFKNSTSYIFLAETAANSKATSPLVTEVAPTVVSKCLPRVTRSAGLYAFLCGGLSNTSCYSSAHAQ